LRSNATESRQLRLAKVITLLLLPERRIKQDARGGYCQAPLATSSRHPTSKTVLTPQAALAEVNHITHDGHKVSEISSGKTDNQTRSIG
jgi:hypothetical protein